MALNENTTCLQRMISQRAQVQQTQYKDAQFMFAEERKGSQGTGLESKE